MRLLILLALLVIIPLLPAYCQVTFIEMSDEYNFVDHDFSCGVGIVDLNNDGVAEIIVISHSGADHLYMWSDSTYVDMGEAYGLSQSGDGHHSIALTDVDKDTWPDIYITGEPYSGNHGHLYINHRNPPFTDEAVSYNLNNVDEMGSSFFQFTPESELAILCGNKLMVRQEQTFIDITQGSGFETMTNVQCPLFFDMDGDFDDDLYVAGNWNQNAGCLFRNNGDTTFTDISTNTNEGGFTTGGGCCFGDIDKDGDFDLYITSSIENSMWENDGTGYFTNISEQSNTGYGGFTRGANFGDFDNDGDIDLFVNRAYGYNMILLNDGQGVFEDCSDEAGVTDNLNGVGCATGDLNNNGQLDIVAVNCDYDQNQIYINQNQNPSFLKIKLVGQYPNTLALGAIVDMYGVVEGTRDYEYFGKRQVVSHSSMFSFNDPIVHFGTGEYEQLRLVVTFNSLAVVDTSGIYPGQLITIIEPEVVSVDESNAQLPTEYFVINTYPNPFNSSVKITISGELDNACEIEIFDILGRRVKSDIIRTENNRYAEYIWNGSDKFGQNVPSGIYLVKVENNGYKTTTKVNLLK